MFDRLAQEIRSLPDPAFYGLVALLAGLVLFAFYAIWRNLYRARLIEDTPTARIRSAPQGYVELEGEGLLLPGMPVVAPLTGLPCLWYRYRVERERRHTDHRGRTHTTWETVDSGVSEAIFALEDGTGRCVIDPDGAEVVPDAKDVWYGSSRRPVAGPGSSPGFFTAGRYRYTEERLLPGHLYAIGWFQSVRNADGDTRAELSALLRAWKRDPVRLHQRFDRDGDGQIDAREWEVARAEAEREVLEARARRAAEPATHLLGRPPDGRQPFILSATPQEDLSSRYRRRALLALGGMILALSALFGSLAVRGPF